MARRAAIAAVLAVFPASMAPADTMTVTTYGCEEIEDLRGIISLDGEARAAYARRKIAQDVCTLMMKGEPVAVLDRAWSGFTKIETLEDGRKYWILEGMTGKE